MFLDAFWFFWSLFFEKRKKQRLASRLYTHAQSWCVRRSTLLLVTKKTAIRTLLYIQKSSFQGFNQITLEKINQRTCWPGRQVFNCSWSPTVGRDLSWDKMSVFVSCFGENNPENISSQLENAGYSLDVQKTTTNNRKRPNDFQI